MENQTKKKVITRLLENTCQASFHIMVKDFWPKVYEVYKRVLRLKDK